MQSLSSTVLLGLVTVFSAQLHLSAQQPYSVIITGRTGDTITIACQNGSADLARIDLRVATGVGIYVNLTEGVRSGTSSNLEDILGTSAVTRGSAGATFRITQHVEGYYSCGPPDAPVISHEPPQAKLLIALKVNGRPVNTRMNYAVQSVDHSVTLLCPFVPGQLQSCYYGQWRRGSTPVVEVEKPDTNCASRGGGNIKENKYHLDRATFSLTISMLEAADSGSYECGLMILDPASPTRETAQFPVQPLNLTVDGEPSIVNGPLDVVVGVDPDGQRLTQNATFMCTAKGLPPPVIRWFYLHPSPSEGDLDLSNSEELTSNIATRNNTESDDDSGRILVTSEILVPVTKNDGGVIRCMTGQVYEEARLTVLDEPTIGITVTTAGGIIYEIQLNTRIQYPVTLNFGYVKGDKTIDRNGPQPTEPFNNTKDIIIRENPDRLPCMDCYVTVALIAVVRNTRQKSPRATSSITIKTGINEECRKHLEMLQYQIMISDRERQQVENSRLYIGISVGVSGFVSLVINFILLVVTIILAKQRCKQQRKQEVVANEVDNIGLLTGNLQKYSEDPHFRKEHQQIIDKINKVVEQLGRLECDSKDDGLLANTIKVLNEAKDIILDKNAGMVPSTQDQEVPVESDLGRHQDNPQKKHSS